MSRLALVVPCYDEAERLDVDAYLEAVDAREDLHLVLVDDGSRDGTGALLESLAARRPGRIEALRLTENQGKAEAVRRGVLHALKAAPDWFGYWDADLATPFDALGELSAAFDAHPQCRLAMGARVQLLGRDIRRSAARHYLGRVFATFASRTLRLPVYDTQCGAKLLRTTPETSHLFDEPFLARWTFDVELLARLGEAMAAAGGPALARVVVEVPLSTWVDVAGSRVRPRDFVLAVRDLWRIRRRYRHSRASRPG